MYQFSGLLILFLMWRWIVIEMIIARLISQRQKAKGVKILE